MKIAVVIAPAALILFCALPSQGKNVVFFPFFQPSHILSVARVAVSLSEHYNHKVWVCVPHYFSERFRTKFPSHLHIISYGEELGDVNEDIFNQTKIVTDFWTNSQSDGLRSVAPVFMKNFWLHVLTNPSFMSRLKEIDPDFFVIDSMPFMGSGLLLPYKFGVPFATVGVNYDVLGARVAFSPASVPMVLFNESFSAETTFVQRLKKSMMYFLACLIDPFWDPNLAQLVVPEKPVPSGTKQLMKDAEVYLVENDVFLGYAYPMLPNTIMIGGTTVVPAEPLDPKYEKIVAGSPNGIVVVSFGSSVSTFPPEVKVKLTKTFQQLPFHIIWSVKMNSPDPSKITTSPWIPQNDLLGHNGGKTTRVFISHCGAWSQYEALSHGVPMLCMPIYVDQWFNGHRIQDKGFGLFTDIRAVSTEDLVSLILSVAQNDTFRSNIQAASKLFKELYKSPKDVAAYWIDHVLQHGGSHLRSVAQQIPLYQFFLLDVITFAVICALILISCLWMVCRMCCTKRSPTSAVEKLKRN